METRKNPVQGTHSVRSVLPVKRSLIDAVLGPPQPLKRQADKPPKAGAGKSRGSSPRRYPDEVILEIRRLREVEGAKTKAIIAALAAKGFEVTADYIQNCTLYRNAGALVPDPDHGPYI